MARLRDLMQLKNVSVDDIIEEDAPLEEDLQLSLIEEEQKNPIKITPADNGKYKIIYGRRRFKALKDAGNKTILCLVVNDITETDLHLEALIENSGTPNEMDEAEHIEYLLSKGFTQKVIAKKVRYSESTITQRLRLLKLIPELRQMLKRGEIKYSAVLELTYLPVDKQKEFLETGNLTLKSARETKNNFQSDVIQDRLFEVETAKSGLYLMPDEMEIILSGGYVSKEYDGNILDIGLEPNSR